MGPIGIAVTRSGEIFVSDNGHERAIELRPDGSFVREWAYLKETLGSVIKDHDDYVLVRKRLGEVVG